MLPFRQFIFRLKATSTTHSTLLLASFMIFFWAIYDGIISYATPILITQRGYSHTAMGLIIAFSSVAGAFMDFILSRLLKNANYLRLFLLVLAISFTYPLLLWTSSGVAFFLFTMSLWGLYYDLYTFALFDFLSHTKSDKKNALGVSVISAFRSLALLIAPIIAGLIITDVVSFNSLLFSLLFLVLAAVFFVLLFINSPVHHHHEVSPYSRQRALSTEITLWQKIGSLLSPILLFNVLCYIFDATFWTIGPLFSEVFPGFKNFGGILMGLYAIPTIAVVWTLPKLVNKFGKKRTAYLSFIIANIFLIPLGWLNNPWVILILVFISSIASSFTFPAIDSAYVDRVTESKSYDTEISGLNDFSTNLGYIFGPIMAGILSDGVGISQSFALLGAINIVLVLFLLKITPRHINIVLHRG